MIRILIVANPQSAATDYYRSVAPLQYMSKSTGGKIKINTVSPTNLEWHTLFDADIIFFSRPNGGMLQDIIIEAKDMGKKVWVDYDDLLDGLSDYNPANVHFNKPEIIESVKLIMAIADTVSVSTTYLKEAYQQYSKNEIIVLKNAFDNRLFGFGPVVPQREQIRLHWRGSATHLGDLWTIKEPITYAIQSDRWRMKFHGLQKFLLYPFPEGYELADWENRLFRYFRHFQEQKPDWVIFPLIDDPFNQAKSNISVIEGLIAGAPALAPAGFPEFVMPGIVNYESPEHLQEILHQIERGEIDKAELVNEGRQWLREFLNVDNENKKRFRIIEKLLGVQFTKKNKAA